MAESSRRVRHTVSVHPRKSRVSVEMMVCEAKDVRRGVFRLMRTCSRT